MDLIEARKIALNAARVLGSEDVPLESALFRVLASDITAPCDLPLERRSRWDGFALRSGDTVSASTRTPVALGVMPGFIAAGSGTAAVHVRGACCRIMTGAVVPADADAVIPFEDAAHGGDRLKITRPVRPGQGTISPGADAASGDLILAAGDVLTPSRIAAAAATGISRAPVRRRPRAAILATGDELRETGRDAAEETTFCNNVHLLDGLVRVRGGEPVHLGIAPDDPDAILSLIGKVPADLVVTTGGMGGGSKDFILEVWKRIGVEVYFESLNISPGKGSAFGSLGDRCFLGLPGNPWSARIVFEEIASPILRRMQGAPVLEGAIEAKAGAAVENNRDFYQAIYGSLRIAAGSVIFLPAKKSSGQALLPAMRNRPAYVLLRPGPCRIEKGETVRVKAPDLSPGDWAVIEGL